MARRLINIAISTATGPIATFSWADNGLLGSASTRTYSATGGTGSGASFTVVRSGGGINSPVTNVTLNAAGTGYTVGDFLTVTENVSPNDTIEITVLTIA